MSHEPRTIRPARVAVATLVALALTTGTVPAPALADGELERLEEAAIAAGEEYQAAQDELDEINGRIAENEERIAEIEEQLPEARERCAEAIRSSYKMQQSQPGLVALVLSAEDFNDFLTMVGYLDSANRANLDDMQELAELEEELEQTSESLEAQRAAAEDKAEAAEQAYEEAQAATEAARAKAAEHAAESKAAYEAQKAAEQDGQGAGDEGGQEGQPPAVSEPEPSQPSGGGSQSSGDWIYVGASTYGIGDGFLWGTTASGDIVTPTSMGVAMKTMPLGTTIEITYNGRTCTAVVNDRGPFIAGREIDLQPAVAEALGFSGVGTVGYRVVG